MSINSVDRAMDLLILLYEEGKEMGVSEMAERLDTYKSTVHRTLITLEGKGFVRQNPETDKYWLGMRLYTIGMAVGNNTSLRDILKPHCDKLQKEFSEVVNASIMDLSESDNPQGIVIYKAYDVNQLLIVNPPEGGSSPLYGSSVGKCLLAFNDVDLDQFRSIELIKHTENTVDNWDDLKKQIEAVKVNGYALDDEELEIGLTCIGAPILDSNNKAVAAISLSGPTQRMKTGDFEQKIKRVMEVARDISKNL